MRAGSTQEEVLDRRGVLRPSENRAHGEELIERGFAVVDLSAGQTELVLQVRRRKYLARHDCGAQPGSILFEGVEDDGCEGITSGLPGHAAQLIRDELHVGGKD